MAFVASLDSSSRKNSEYAQRLSAFSEEHISVEVELFRHPTLPARQAEERSAQWQPRTLRPSAA
jgi:hypothetical protein